MRLHSFRRCPFAIRVRLTLEEKSLPYERIEEDLSRPSAALLALNPSGEVPVLVHGERVITQSAVITEYLDEVFPEPRLMPGSPWAKAQARLWTHWCAQEFKPDLDLFKYERGRLSATEASGLEARLSAHLAKLEEALSVREFLLEEGFSLADIHVFPFIRQFSRVEPPFQELPRFASVAAWRERIASRPGFQRAMAKEPPRDEGIEG